MIFMKKNDIGYDFVITKCLRIFKEFNYWFIYIELPKYTIRLSNASHYLNKRRK